jgi:biotin carboxylase
MGRPKLLITGGSHADVPLILAGRQLGFYVITTGNRPEDIGHQFADEYHPADFSSLQAMLDLAKRTRISAICSCCNDFGALSAAYVAEKLGLPGHDPFETAQIIHHKDRYRSFAHSNGIPTPRACGVQNIEEGLKVIRSFPLPVIVKPVDLTGGKGISVVTEPYQAEDSLTKALKLSRAGRIVVEEFVTGTRHGFSAFLVGGKVVFYFTDNEHYYLNPYLVAAASTPTTVSKEVVQRLCEICERISSLLTLTAGILHIQFISDENTPVIIEICRRAPGDLYVQLVKHATGVDYAAWIVRAATGLDCDGLRHAEPRGCFVRYCVMAHSTGTLKRVSFEKSIERNVIDRVMWWKSGDYVSDVLTTKFGIVFLKFDSQAEMLAKVERMHDLIRVEMV